MQKWIHFKIFETVLKLKVFCFGEREHVNWRLINFYAILVVSKVCDEEGKLNEGFKNQT